MSTSHGICLQVSIYIDPSNVDAFFTAMKPVFDACVAEPELLSFEIFRSPDDPGKISWVENWKATKEWLFETQIQKEYYKEYFAVTEPMFIKPREFQILDRVGPPFAVYKPTLLAGSS